MTRIVWYLLGWLAFLIAACFTASACSGGSPDTDGHAFEIVGDVAVTHGGPLYEGELFSYEPIMYMKEDLDRPESIMAMPYQFFSDDRSWFYVSDYNDGNIVVFNADGEYVRRIGRKGEGPGEFTRPTIQCVYGGIINVWDASVRRVTQYRVDGELVDTFQMPNVYSFSTDPEAPRISPSGLHIVDADNHLVLLSSFRTPQGERYQAAGAMMLDAEGDTVWSFMSEEAQIGYPTMIRGPNGEQFESMAMYPFGPRIGSYYAPQLGIVVIAGWDGDVRIYGLDGELARTYRLDSPPDEFTEEDRAGIRAYYDELLEDAPDEDYRDRLKSQLKSMKLPEHKAYFGGAIKVDDAGYLFVGTTDDYVVRGVNGVPYHVFSPDGEYLGKTRRPGGRSSEVWQGRLLISSADAETPEEQLVVYAMRPVPVGFKYP